MKTVIYSRFKNVFGNVKLGLKTNLLSEKSEKLNQMNNSMKILQENRNDSFNSFSTSYTNEFSQRFNLVLKILNEYYKGEYSISKLAEIFEFEKVRDLENIVNGHTEPSVKFVQNFSDYFGIEIDWLKHGINPMFRVKRVPELWPEELKKHIIALNPEKIYFVRSNDSDGMSGIVLKVKNQSYLVLSDTYKLSKEVGRTGRIQIISFYKLLKNLSNSKEFSLNNLDGVQLDRNQFDALFSGTVLPIKVLSQPSKKSYWYEDFQDYERKEPIAKSYEAMYGSSFIEAQKFIEEYEDNFCKMGGEKF